MLFQRVNLKCFVPIGENVYDEHAHDVMGHPLVPVAWRLVSKYPGHTLARSAHDLLAPIASMKHLSRMPSPTKSRKIISNGRLHPGKYREETVILRFYLSM